jgi:anti-sigma B factor antagonist
VSIASTALSINLSRDRDRLIVTLHGDLDAHAAPALADVLLAAVECQEHTVLVDLAGVGFIDSSGLTILLSAHRRLGRAGGWLIAVDPSPAVVRIFEMTGLDNTISVIRHAQATPRLTPPMFPRSHVPL